MTTPVPIPHLVNGVSQQPAQLRQPTQSSFEENTTQSVVKGLGKRAPTEYVAKIADGELGAAHIHTINRDASERYTVVLTDGGVAVYDMDGDAMTISSPDGLDYLLCDDPETAFDAVTVADYTFIVNREVTAAMDAATTTDRGDECLIFVKQGGYGRNYNVEVNGSGAATYTTSTTAVATLATDTIAADLASDLTTTLGAGWSVDRVGAVIHLRKDDGSAFDCQVTDSNSGQDLLIVKGTVQRFTQLPTVAPHGFVVKIAGDPESGADDYYVQFVANDPSADLDDGVWAETVAMGITHEFDPSTMPHTLVRTGVDTFTFSEAAWGSRTAGDETSAPDPSFIGNAIQSVFFWKNRLGFLADDNVIMSRAGEFFEFFRSTVTTLLDSDPIDVGASDNAVHTFRHAVPHEKKLIVFSDTAQFEMEGNPTLTPKTVALDKTTAYNAIPGAKPVTIGRRIYFAEKVGGYSAVREYSVDDSEDAEEAADVTAHVPRFLKGQVVQFAASSGANLLICRTDDASLSDRLFTYRFYWGVGSFGTETKLQSAWGRWKLGGTILSATFIEDVLYVVVQYADAVYLESMLVEDGQVDEETVELADDGTESYPGWLCHLDRRVTEADCTVTYNSGDDTTTFTLPYAPSANVRVVTRVDVDDAAPLPAGVVLQVVEVDGNDVTVRDRHDGDQTVWIGEPYTMRYRFSPVFVRQSLPTGGVSALTDGRTQVLTGTLHYDATGYFSVTVTSGDNTSTKTFTGSRLGSGSTVIGKLNISGGSGRFPVQRRNTAVDIDIVNTSHLPSWFQSADFEANYVSRGRQP